MTMTISENDYKKLEFLKSTNKKLHIKIIGGGDVGRFRNGFILDISLIKECIVFVDDVLGELPYLFEEIDIPAITFFKREGEKREDDRNNKKLIRE